VFLRLDLTRLAQKWYRNVTCSAPLNMIKASDMNLLSLVLVFAVLALSFEKAGARGQAEHVVVVVWDGLRPDFITPQYTPALYELATKGAFFVNNHSPYITPTEVN